MVMSSHAAAENDKMVVAKLPWKAQHNWQFFGQIFCQDRKRNIECQKCLQWTRFRFFSLHPSPCGWYRAKESEIAADGWELTKYLNFLKARALLENQKKKKKLQNRSYFNLLNSSLCMCISNNRLSKAWRKHCWHVGEQRTWRNWKHRTWTIVLFDYNVSISVCKTCMLFPYLWPIIFKISINYTNKNYHHCKPYVIIIVLPLDESD